MSPLEVCVVLLCLLLQGEGEGLDQILGDAMSLCLLSPGCVEVGTGLSSALSLLLIISVS